MNPWNFPDLGIGVGLRTVHFGHILSRRPAVDWFEVLSENFMDTGGWPLRVLDQVAERYPVALHGVSLSIGGSDPLDREYLRKLKQLAARTRARRVRQVSELLERPLVLENPSSYVEFAASTMTEWEFLSRLAEEADCGLLLDVNNVYVSSFNHGFDPRVYVDSVPPDRVVQYHVAGHTHKGSHILDSHSDHAVAEVWELFRRSC